MYNGKQCCYKETLVLGKTFVVGFSCTEIPRFYVLIIQGYAPLPCLLLLSSMSACSASLGYKVPVCGNQ